MLRLPIGLLAMLVLFATSPTAAQTEANFIIVVNESNPVSALSTTDISQLFLKKATWASGDPAAPVDLTSESVTRRAFTSVVHRRSISSVKSYWQQQVFSGRAVPPPEKPSDSDVLEFVRSNPGAIGYVSAAADVGDGVKIVAVALK